MKSNPVLFFLDQTTRKLPVAKKPHKPSRAKRILKSIVNREIIQNVLLVIITDDEVIQTVQFIL